MSDEKEIIEILENLAVDKYIDERKLEEKDIEAIINIIVLYRQEKEKNKELSDKLTEKICKGVEEEILEEYRKEIKHQKEKRENQKKELAILNAKQIEFNKLVNTVNSYKGQFKRQQKELEELKEDSCCMTNCVRRDKEKLFLEDKIKAKIEEIDKILERNLLVDSLRDYFEAQKEVLHSLLEKE